MSEPTSCCSALGGYCERCDLLVGLNAFHVVKLATQVVDDVCSRVRQDTCGHRGYRKDPLYRIRNTLRAGAENLTDRQKARLAAAWAADERHVEVQVAWSCAQLVRSAYHQDSHTAGRAIAEKILASFTSCPIPETEVIRDQGKGERTESVLQL